MANNDFFDRMCKDAAEELASGEKGWKDMDHNTLMMACFHLLTNHLTHKLSRPLWFFASAVSIGVLTLIMEAIWSHFA